jgi:hypothetical protein
VTLFKLMRIVALLSVLFVILVSAWMTERRMAAWERPILVTIYPIVADDVPGTAEFAENLDLEVFEKVNDFFDRETSPYGIKVTPAFRGFGGHTDVFVVSQSERKHRGRHLGGDA